MNTIEAIYARRAIKHFDPAHRMTDTEITTLIEAAMQSPTSFNLQHWRFVVVTEPALRQQIRAAAWDQAQVTDASILIVMTADPNVWQTQGARVWANAPEPARSMISGMIQPFHAGREFLHRDEAMRSIGMAMQTIMLAAKDMGYDSCPMIGFDFDAVAKLINLPAGYVIGPLVAVGLATKPAWPKPGQLPITEVLVRDRFSA